jgi:hypothetical protein
MTSYAASIDLTETGNGLKFSATVGSGGVTAGQPVKWDGSGTNTVVASTTTTDIIVGLARDTVSATGVVTVLSNGCLVKTPYTLTLGGKVGVGTSGTAGTCVDYSTGVLVGTVVYGATTASVVRVNIQLVMA